MGPNYEGKGLVVIGVHSPEFSYERSVINVQNYIREHAIKYPVAIDNDFRPWKRYNNRYWPAIYLIDRRGIMRYLRVEKEGISKPRSKFLPCLGNLMAREMVKSRTVLRFGPSQKIPRKGFLWGTF